MPITQKPTTVDQAFFQPLTGLADASPHARPCPEFSDEDCLHLGVQRVLETSASGRGFLQEHGLRFPNTPGHSNYFAALKSPRRREVIREVNLALVAAANATLHDRLADIPELATYECFAQDGHWHKAGAHDPRHDGTKMAVGHFYSLNLRTHTLRHLAAAQGLHEHDMGALKRVKPKGLRQGVSKGKRALIIYDKSAIDFAYWKRCRQEGAIYFISRMAATGHRVIHRARILDANRRGHGPGRSPRGNPAAQARQIIFPGPSPSQSSQAVSSTTSCRG